MRILIKLSRIQSCVMSKIVKLKVITVVGTRPELIRLSRIIPRLDKYCDHVLVHTGQNYDYELNEIFFDDLGIRKPNFFLNAAGKSPSETIGKVISEMDKLLSAQRPQEKVMRTEMSLAESREYQLFIESFDVEI